MSGHSKWATTKRQKAVVDAKRGKTFTKLANAISMAAKSGGGDPDSNVTLRFAIDKAKQANMPNQNIERAIKRGTGELVGDVLEEFTYEAVGPGGSAFIIEGVTDKKTRTVSDLRQLLGYNNVRLAESGSQAWQFKRVGRIEIDLTAGSGDVLEQAQLDAIEAGAEDVSNEGQKLTVLCQPTQLTAVRDVLSGKNYSVAESEIVYMPNTKLTLGGQNKIDAEAAYAALEDHDDVQRVAVNF